MEENSTCADCGGAGKINFQKVFFKIFQKVQDGFV